MAGNAEWLSVRRGNRPLVVSLPHTGTEIPDQIARRLVSKPLALLDTDWWIDRLYDFAADLDATVIRTAMSRTVIDVNRDPSGASLYPGQNTTELCPLATFDGAALYRRGEEPDATEAARRMSAWFEPYHAALRAETARLRSSFPRVILYDCHSIRSVIPRLFAGALPHFNIGTNGGASCDPALTAKVAALCAGTRFDTVVDGRFRGGWITRHYGRPADGVHAIQMELACRTYLGADPPAATPDVWPVPYDPAVAQPARAVLIEALKACTAFAEA